MRVPKLSLRSLGSSSEQRRAGRGGSKGVGEPLASKPGCCAESGLRWARPEAGSLVGRLSRRSGDEMVVVRAGEWHSRAHRKTAADANSVLSRGF